MTEQRIPITETLQHIGASNQPLARRELKALSGLDRSEHNEFWASWNKIAPERRGEIARVMAEIAEDNVELDYDQAWFWLLDDGLIDVRVSAIEGLWENTTPQTLRRMQELLRDDPTADVRAAAATALSRFAHEAMLGELEGDPAALRQALLDAAHSRNDPPEVRRRALESVGYFDDDEVQEHVERAYAAEDQLLRESALVAMGRSMQERWLPTIQRELDSPSPALRYEAAHAAGEMAENARPLLAKIVPLCNDQDSEVALVAIWALGQIGGEPAKRALQQLSKSQDAVRGPAASEALEELNLGETLI